MQQDVKALGLKYTGEKLIERPLGVVTPTFANPEAVATAARNGSNMQVWIRVYTDFRSLLETLGAIDSSVVWSFQSFLCISQSS